MSARDAFDSAPLELRILTGRHAGARTQATEGLVLGADERADIVLTDLATDAGDLRLHLAPAGGWSLVSAAETHSARIGGMLRAGGLALSVGPVHADWPATLPEDDKDSSLLVDPIVAGQPDAADAEASLVAVHPADTASDAPPAPAALSSRRSIPLLQRMVRSPAAIAVAALLVLLVPLSLALWNRGRLPAADAVSLSPPVTEAPSPRLLADIGLAIARVDPALRLQVLPQPGGGVMVTGWVESTAQFDRVAEALAGIRPVPALQLRIVGELREELRGQLGRDGPALDFRPLSAGRLLVTGMAVSPADRDRKLETVRALAPRDIELVDGLDLAADQAPAFQAALRQTGFRDATARWDGSQVAIGVRLSNSERGRFEDALLQLGKRFSGVPFSVTVETYVPPVAVVSGAPAPVPTGAVPLARAGLPFQVRSIVGGPAPYLVLGDGDKLMVGGSRGGWRLAAVEPEFLIFEGPRRLTVLR